jgi:hypothetical protein
MRFLYNYTMLEQSKEARILLAIQALQTNSKLRVLKAAKIYNVPENTLHDRMSSRTSRSEIRLKNRLLSELEEKVLLQHILDLDARGFSSKIEGVEDIANYIFKKRPVGKL